MQPFEQQCLSRKIANQYGDKKRIIWADIESKSSKQGKPGWLQVYNLVEAGNASKCGLS